MGEWKVNPLRPEVLDRVGGGIAIGTPLIDGIPGSVLFVDSAGALGQDNANFFWDDSNNRLGLGNSSPATTLDITGTLRVSSSVTLSSLTSGRIPFATTNGLLVDSPDLTFDGTTLSTVNFSASLSGFINIFTANSGDITSNFNVGGELNAVGNITAGLVPDKTILYSTGGILTGDDTFLSADYDNKRVGIGIVIPTARLHLPVGTTVAGSSPLKFDTGGVLMTSPENHAVEVINDHIYFTINTGTARKEITLSNTAIGQAEVVFGSGAARITSSGKMTFDDIDGQLAVSGSASSANYVLGLTQPSSAGNGLYFSLNSASSARIAMRIADASLNNIFNLTTDGTLTLRGNFKFLTDATYTIGASSANRPLSVYVSDLTTTGVVFSGTGTKLTVDATNFVWDDSNNRLGIGISVPTTNLHVVGTSTLNGTTTVGNGTNALLNLGVSNITAGAFANGLDFNFLPAGGIRFIVQGSDGPGFQAFGGTYPSLAGQIYFDFGSVARSLASRAVFFRDLQSGGATVLKIDGTGVTVTGTATISSLTSGRVIFAGASGLLTSDADMTFATDTLTVTKIAAHQLTGNLTIADGINLILNTTTGTKIGTATTQKLAFFNSTPIVQPANTVAIDTLLVNLGFQASGGVALFDTDIKAGVVGKGLYVKEGTNATMGTATLAAGTVVVNTTKVTANSRILVTVNGGTLTNVGSTYISARTAGTSFTISSTNVLDSSAVAWIILEPA